MIELNISAETIIVFFLFLSFNWNVPCIFVFPQFQLKRSVFVFLLSLSFSWKFSWIFSLPKFQLKLSLHFSFSSVSAETFLVYVLSLSRTRTHTSGSLHHHFAWKMLPLIYSSIKRSDRLSRKLKLKVQIYIMNCIHMWKTLAWPHHFTEGRLRPINWFNSSIKSVK